MEANSLIDVLNCARLQRYSRYVWETQNKLLIGIPVTPDADINTIGKPQNVYYTNIIFVITKLILEVESDFENLLKERIWCCLSCNKSFHVRKYAVI